MPIGLPTGVATVVINNNGTVLRGFVVIVASQPDIFTTTNGPGGRAMVFNVTNPINRMGEPFSVTSDDGTGNQVPTVLEIDLTGVRGATASGITVTIGTTDIVATFIASNPEMPGFDMVKVTLPASLAGAGDVPIIVRTSSATSRGTDTAPHITISP
jgi:uncharacterized protein (TIGR03437 family)